MPSCNRGPFHRRRFDRVKEVKWGPAALPCDSLWTSLHHAPQQGAVQPAVVGHCEPAGDPEAELQHRGAGSGRPDLTLLIYINTHTALITL